ncbi:uncharacterized protein Tco025E_08496 [Trypanosoma conorhini]|uniref:Uncharacterized protein n=1 Tax=Trypanosoma conorhini TaxID=83891 RepID=A0A422N9M1_9TRYP|nr:uncharacterized protein Tco025E_08496 [Trypanosoma conorhini]RNF02160.1 hypothetical protein Tco025E_08496 [Trypanosoma conorhini]
MRRAAIPSTSLREQLVRATGRNAAESFARLPRLEEWDNCNAHFPGSRSATVADAPVERGREFLAGGGGRSVQGLAVKRARPRHTPGTHLPRCSVELPKGNQTWRRTLPPRRRRAPLWRSVGHPPPQPANWRGAGRRLPWRGCSLPPPPASVASTAPSSEQT